MSTLIRRPLNPMFNACVVTMCKAVWPQWFDTTPTPQHDSFKLLKAEYAARGRITVYSGDCSNNIFDDPDINVMFRAWHDWCHLKQDAGFSQDGERRAAALQMHQVCQRYGYTDTGAEFCKLIDAEVNGQAAYYDRHKKYVQDQRAFVAAYIRSDAEHVLEREW